MAKRTLHWLMAAGFACWGVVAQAGIVYSNGSPNQANGSAVYGEAISTDDVRFNSDTLVGSMSFHTLEAPGGWDGSTLLYLIMPDVGGVPDPALGNAYVPFTNGVDVTRVATGQTAFGGAFDEYEYTFSFANDFLFMADTTYWIGLYLGFSSTSVFWEATDNLTGNTSHFSLLGGFEANSGDLAFALYDVPAPASLLLVALGMMGFGLQRRFRR